MVRGCRIDIRPVIGFEFRVSHIQGRRKIFVLDGLGHLLRDANSFDKGCRFDFVFSDGYDRRGRPGFSFQNSFDSFYPLKCAQPPIIGACGPSSLCVAENGDPSIKLQSVAQKVLH